MEQLREKMMNQKSVAGVQKYMHQFNKGTRKDKNGKGTGNHKNDIVFKEVENSFGNIDRCLKVLSRYVYTQIENEKVMSVYDVYHEEEKEVEQILNTASYMGMRYMNIMKEPKKRIVVIQFMKSCRRIFMI